MCSGAESEHDHHRLAESSRHKEVLTLLYFARSPETDGSHCKQIQHQYENVGNVQSKHKLFNA
jgi:hypothetical protein